MARDVVYGSIDESRDLDGLVRLIGFAFASEPKQAREWLQRAGTDNLRGTRKSGSSPVEACLVRIPMGQYFGAKSVPMSGIAGVAVGPESRGGGLATSMMTACIREIASEGIALSTLYASTQQLYRKVGYEVAGMSYLVTLPVKEIRRNLPASGPAAGPAAGFQVQQLTEHHEQSIHATYRQWARGTPGMLDRGCYIWNRVKVWREVPHTPFGVISPAGEVLAYAYLAQDRNTSSGKHHVKLSDIAWQDAIAGRALIEFLGAFTTMAEDLKFSGSPTHPVIGLLGHTIYSIEMKDPWMLRICDVQAALRERGYPHAFRGSLALDIYDPIVPDNNACWGLEVAGGDGHVQRGAPTGSAIRCSVHTLAQMYTGYLSASELSRRGLLTGSAGAIEMANLIFAGDAPYMTDFF
jgi:predicted acetyltransferase